MQRLQTSAGSNGNALQHRRERREDGRLDRCGVPVAARADERADHGDDERLDRVGRRALDDVGQTQRALLALLGRA